MLLHGLAGHAGEWKETAAWLTASHRVVALDARGHGGSTRRPADVSRAAHVADVVHAIERLELAPAVLIGHSVGGLTALLLAARHPALVARAVLAEATPDAGGDGAASAAAITRSLRRWPVPFASRTAAVAHFGGPGPRAEAWADGLEPRDDGLWPRFDVDVMARTIQEADDHTYWDEWERIACPLLVIRSEHGLPAEAAREMVRRARRAQLVEVAGAGHDVHLDAPSHWRRAVAAFLD